MGNDERKSEVDRTHLTNPFASALDRMLKDEEVLCVIDRKYFEHLEDLKKVVYVIATEGSKLLISNKRPGYRPAALSGERESGS